MDFGFATATRIIFGPGKISELPPIAQAFGDCALLVTGRTTGRATSVVAGLEDKGVTTHVFPVPSEPTLNMVRWGVEMCRRGCRVVISFGGGSVIDAGKAIAALAPNSGEPLDYLEVIGHGRPLERAPLPFIAIPTTAGTGSEVTRNAVLGSPEHRVKASLRGSQLVAKVALVDPDLTLNLPPSITANTGLDALTQVIEPYVSSKANAMTDIFCREGLRRIAESLVTAYEDGADRQARESMAFASLLGGLSLANAGLGVVHGFAAPLGGMLHAPHGALCAAVLPHGIAANIRALRLRKPTDIALQKYTEIARVLSGQEDASPEEAVRFVDILCKRLGVQSLAAHGLKRDQMAELVHKAQDASSMKANPIALLPSELEQIVEAAL